ncbi:UNVERIFIED_CONTAM: AAA-ATPase [Sesamum calycinum]|uniref:AAA-ATPase n=1 Tax=Sesamum calycinum TaxID=2727403 RepID=A0AAW2MMX5_9LAMI
MQSFWEMQSMATNIFSAYASVAASVMLYRSMVNDIIPEPVKAFFYSMFDRFFKSFFDRFFGKISTHVTVVIDEQNGFTRNQIYDAAEIYLRTIINPEAERLKANKSSNQKNISLSIEKGQELTDSYNGFQLKWQFILVEPDGTRAAKAKEMKENERAVKLYTRDCPFDNNDDDGGGNGGGYWGCVNLDHPVTFDKLAMDPNMKRAIIEDLDRFVRRKDYYRKVGKAWKRGYLLYGPPGTGKSSLVAAIANYLRFDVYDLELTSVYSNSELRRILLCTKNKSILVIEDIDCSGQMHDRERDTQSADEDSSNTRLTLSGLLNFIDGLWSTCGDERIIIFTTNHKEKLDPALLRPGRMDMHIHMGYCTPEAFDVLALNYLGINDHHRLFPEIKRLIREIEITPAEIAEHLMRSEDADLALEGVVDLLKQKEKKKKTETLDDQKMSDVVEKESDEGVDQEKKRKFGRIMKDLTNFRRRSSRITGKRKML